jgi:hypothetical protein
MRGEPTSRPAEEEFSPGAELSVAQAVSAYRARAEATDTSCGPCHRWRSRACAGRSAICSGVLLHLINETGRHAGHADATRELLDGTTGQVTAAAEPLSALAPRLDGPDWTSAADALIAIVTNRLHSDVSRRTIFRSRSSRTIRRRRLPDPRKDTGEVPCEEAKTGS